MRISGAQLKDYLERSARYFQVDPVGRIALNDSVPGYNYDVVAGARYDIDLRRPVGDRIRDLAVRGRPVQPADSFTLAVNSYRQTGAGGYDMLRGAPVVYDKGERIRDLLIEEIRTRGARSIPPSYAGPRLAHRAGGRRPRGARPVRRARPSRCRRAARDTVLLRVLATADLHGAPAARAPARSAAALRQPGRRLRLPAAAARRGRRDAGHRRSRT